jgi:hypothetical protein
MEVIHGIGSFADVHLYGGRVHCTLMGCYERQTDKYLGGRPYYQSGDIFLYYFEPKAEWHVGDQVGAVYYSIVWRQPVGRGRV